MVRHKSHRGTGKGAVHGKRTGHPKHHRHQHEHHKKDEKAHARGSGA